MAMVPKKRNFGEMEKKVFIEILKNFKHIVESKDTDGACLRAKKAAWERIALKFNASPHATSQVTHKQLRRLWMNLKQRQRTALKKGRQYRVGIGGWPSSDTYIDPNNTEVEPALIGIDNSIGSDTLDEESIEYDQNPTESKFQPTQQLPPTDTDLKHSILPLSPTTTSSTWLTPHPPQTLPLPNQQLPANIEKFKTSILEREYKDRQKKADELHLLEINLLHEKIREAKAKADLAELILHQKKGTADKED